MQISNDLILWSWKRANHHPPILACAASSSGSQMMKPALSTSATTVLGKSTCAALVALKAPSTALATAERALVMLTCIPPLAPCFKTLERRWRLFKASLRGTYISIPRKQMQRYPDELTFRTSHRRAVNGMLDSLVAAF
jgi:hypothetical protein